MVKSSVLFNAFSTQVQQEHTGFAMGLDAASGSVAILETTPSIRLKPQMETRCTSETRKEVYANVNGESDFSEVNESAKSPFVVLLFCYYLL